MVAFDLKVFDLILRYRDGHRNVAAEALGGAGISSGHEEIVAFGFRNLGNRFSAGSRESLGCGVFYRLARQRRAGDAVHFGTLCCKDLICKLRDRFAAHVGRLGIPGDLNFCDAAVLTDRERYLDRTAETDGFIGVCAGLILSGCVFVACGGLVLTGCILAGRSGLRISGCIFAARTGLILYGCILAAGACDGCPGILAKNSYHDQDADQQDCCDENLQRLLFPGFFHYSLHCMVV